MMKRFWKKILGHLPKEGTMYTYKRKGCAYNGMRGVVHYHDCGTRFMINTGNSWLTNINP